MSFSKNHELQFAIDKACRVLPQEYTIHIRIEQGATDVVLYDVDGDECDFPTSGESLSQSINDAVQFAEAKQ